MTRAELKEHCEKTCAQYEKFYINSYLGNKRYEEHKLVLELLEEIETLEKNKRIEYGTDGNPYIMSISNGSELPPMGGFHS